MKLIWLVGPALVAVVVSGCSDDKSTSKESSSSSNPGTSSSRETTPAAADDETGVRIPLGETKKVAIPADAVMDIRVPAEWGQAANDLRCTVVDSSGRNEDLRSSDVKKTESLNGKDWMTVWTFSAAPAGDVTVGCKDPDSKIAAAHPDAFVRVVPRGVLPVPTPR
ncbi:hypothetical protein DFR70_102893 [Nocardia tenerifensis]|uniref:Uncharacterized protein n=1 Tax=Nocardia tenerifensis TaxID=228006 RepID=A0A318K7X0_9NOCA|nr:hypothetical protein [Nocardia tenerifensis]PXX69205.1 hypothetical protein DFR70_102893 [Nocardia tenerifensis]